MELTEINHLGKIFALSDIHGDLHSFIISLRDCAKVIKKDINLSKLDPDIEENLIIDISIDDNCYDDSLGYTWCGNNSYVVICGDIIDPNRSNGCLNDNGTICGEYPQIEIKLIRFINAINKQAVTENGRIIKILGNHELFNILGSHLDNVYESDRTVTNYYRCDKRGNVFNVGHSGFKLLFEDGCYLLVKINNSIFVHGQLPKFNISKIEEINKFMNDIDNQKEDEITFKKWEEKLKVSYNQGYGPLWDREWAGINNINYRNEKNIQLQMVERVKNDLINFIGNNDIEKLRVIVGHCPQNSSSTKNLINTTMTHKISQDTFSKTYSSLDYYNGQITDTNQDTIFGITMQCPKLIQEDCHTDFYVYHVDISSSRGFDKLEYYNTIVQSSESNDEAIRNENRYLFSKTPQILCIEQIYGRDFITIIKSKMRNTRIHLPRPNYERLIKNFSSLNYNKPGSLYDNKYKKYKKKYLQLKNKLYN